jgi:hypothetical protein
MAVPKIKELIFVSELMKNDWLHFLFIGNTGVHFCPILADGSQ